MYQQLIRAVFQGIVLLSAIALPAVSSAENLKLTVSKTEYGILTSVFEEIEKGFESTPHTITWVQLSAEEVLKSANDYDGMFGSIPLGSPMLQHLTQVPAPLLKQALVPIVLESTSCPNSVAELSSMQVVGIEHFDAFTTVEQRIKRPIPRLPSLADVMSALETGEADASVSIDYMLPVLDQMFDIDLKLCPEVRVRSFVYYIYLHNRHADKIDGIRSALGNGA